MKLLIIEDDVAFSNTLARRMSKMGFECQVVNYELDIFSQCSNFVPDYVLLDMKLERSSGLQHIAKIREILPNCKLVLLTGFASIATAVEAIKLGADDYLTKPADTKLISKKLLGEAVSIEDSFESTMSPERLEWEHIQQTLQANDGNVSETARQLNMHRRTLQRKLQKKPVSK
ncbi:response regulator transcription factor [Pseudoalteromonas luteoviolacea]|uniref:Chemotaxis protein CheY n=1 Tax=Pseudoalteromonas luteoviolacea S4054 TaxID=1129367 RepID=A0A0F6A6H7_9GAMM|nr:response regulator [Pseudoalteromonas luteoviolacea]AOT10488.1 two-component system response regulator [Pseudoalteromonas luteoviolacea]AOT15443.1 two-component system response regulator [Pseudoalteromonas luteoviolacea]AOT20307.1 two-component system response regulator [Pseudoalteromonas luteoviolacea]KKE81436.1 chemotaxis protein CheY [Pseudoalteromonas luteoviolacea S4054]KZN71667.1 chemotaxis protein CheY [Pseudoalteromonas luteoviolacea S4047-1]